MKRIIAILLLVLCLSLCSCNTSVSTEHENAQGLSMFIELESTYTWTIVYHRETKVMYAVSGGHYNLGTFTVLLNADGTPMTYEGE